MKNWMIQIEGIDKTGKDLLVKYIEKLSNYKYVVRARGIISLLAYNDIYKRNNEYLVTSSVTTDWVFVYLYGEKDDIKIRCEINNEEFKGDDEPYFKKYVNTFSNYGFHVFQYNVSELTYYNIAKDIIQKMEDLNNGNIL